jgi:hypothetical protein
MPRQNPFGRCNGHRQPLIPNRDHVASLDEYLRLPSVIA